MLSGRRVSLSTAKFLPPHEARDLEAARDLALLWERTGRRVRPDDSAAPVAEAESESPRPTVEMAVRAYMTDARDRGNSDGTLDKKAAVFERIFITDPKHRDGSQIPTNTTSLLWFCRQRNPILV
jgi:hypothetical protein